MNPVVMATHNAIEFTIKCVESIRNQDVPTQIFMQENGSSDGTVEWLLQQPDLIVRFSPDNLGFSAAVNLGVSRAFAETNSDFCTVANNDTVLSPWTIRTLTGFEKPFVTGVSCEDMDAVMTPYEPQNLVTYPDFSLICFRRDCWETLGGFREEMINYASDCCLGVRAHRKGIELLNSGLKFFHRRSSTLASADPMDRRRIEMQADADRAIFKSIYGCFPWEPAYADLFKPELFGSEK